MSQFYTKVEIHRNEILYRGYLDGEPIKYKDKYQPYVFLKSDDGERAEYQTVHGKPVSRMDFESIRDARDFMEKYSGIDNFEIYGMTDWSYLYIYDQHPQTVEYDPKFIRVANIDIETMVRDIIP